MNATKPHLRKFLTTVKIGDEQPINEDGFWKKPETSTADQIKRELRNQQKQKRNR